MKVEDVPQDPSHYNGHKRLCYATGGDGRYVRALSSGWETETVVTDRALSRLGQLTTFEWARVSARKRTPLKAVLVSRQISSGMLAAQVRLPRVLVLLAQFPHFAALMPRWVWTKFADGLGWRGEPLLLRESCTPEQAEHAMSQILEL